MSKPYTVLYEATPNPHSMKFYWGGNTGDTAFFENLQGATRSPLAHKLFGFPWMKAVLVGEEFVTISKQEWVDWQILAEPLCDLISEHLERGEPILLKNSVSPTEKTTDSSVVELIKQILETEIRPAVQMDGGEVLFDRYDNGVLYVSMQGACAGCPSSSMTLKQGIEARLKEAIPELKEVISI